MFKFYYFYYFFSIYYYLLIIIKIFRRWRNNIKQYNFEFMLKITEHCGKKKTFQVTSSIIYHLTVNKLIKFQINVIIQFILYL